MMEQRLNDSEDHEDESPGAADATLPWLVRMVDPDNQFPWIGVWQPRVVPMTDFLNLPSLNRNLPRRPPPRPVPLPQECPRLA